MKLSAAVAGLFVGSVFCSVISLKGKDSERMVELSPELSSLLENYSGEYNPKLVYLSKGLNVLSLNEAMKLMSKNTNIHGRDMAWLLADNNVVKEKPHGELIDYGFGYGLTWFLRALLFNYAIFKDPFDRHVYAAMMYKRRRVLQEEWQDQLELDRQNQLELDDWHDQHELDWDTYYQAIFKADNPDLLCDMVLFPGVFSQEGKSSKEWKNPTNKTLLFIKEHLRHLITHYDSARILEALTNEKDPAKLLLPVASIKEIKAAIITNLKNHMKLHITGYHQKLRTFLKIPVLRRELGYDELKFALEHGCYKSSGEQMLSNIRSRGYDWELEMLYRRGLLGTIDEAFIMRAISSGSCELLEWIYDRIDGLSELRVNLEGLIERLAPQRSSRLRYEILKVHRGAFADYVPSQELVNLSAASAEGLDFLETFEPPLRPQQVYIRFHGDFNQKLRVLEANPGWEITDEEIGDAVKNNHSGFVAYALEQRGNQKIMLGGVCNLQLLQHNIKADPSYVPSEAELDSAFSKDDVGVVELLYEQMGRSEEHNKVYSPLLEFLDGKEKSFELVKWLKDAKGIGPSESDMRQFAEVGNLEACKWAWTFLADKQSELTKSNPILILNKEVIQWWREKIDGSYIPDTSKAIFECVKRRDIDSACWIAEQWNLNLSINDVMNFIVSRHYSDTAMLDFFELMYMYQEGFSCEYIRRGFGFEMKIISRPNLKRIMAKHARVGHHIPLDEWELILQLPDLYGGVNSRALKVMVGRGDDKIIELLRSHGHLEGYEDVVGGSVEGITGKFTEMTV